MNDPAAIGEDCQQPRKSRPRYFLCNLPAGQDKASCDRLITELEGNSRPPQTVSACLRERVCESKPQRRNGLIESVDTSNSTISRTVGSFANFGSRLRNWV